MTGSEAVELLEPLVKGGRLEPLDLEAGRFISRLPGGDDPIAVTMAVLAGNAVSTANSCVDLHAIENQFPWLREVGLPVPPPHQLVERLAQSPLVAQGDGAAPLVLDAHRLYLRRYFVYEEGLARMLLDLALQPSPELEEKERKRCRHVLDRFFQGGDGCDYQRVGAVTALLKGLCVISGGPGTGKTRSVAAIIALDIQLRPGGSIALAAPTGKAAARMAESIKETFCSLGMEYPDLEPKTLHRLLGADGRGGLRYTRANRLPYGLVVVDEASMVDLPMMFHLVSTLAPGSRLVLLGDRDQLASVEAGNVLADICRAAGSGGYSEDHARLIREISGDELPSTSTSVPPLRDSVVELRRNFRFGHDSPLGRLAEAVKAGDGPGALELLLHGGGPSVQLRTPAEMPLQALLEKDMIPRYRRWLKAGDALEVLERQREFRVLSGLREGPAGSVAVNGRISTWLRPEAPGPHWRELFCGMPVMVIRNSYLHGLFNGDTGVVWQDKDSSRVAVWFDTGKGLAAISPAALPPFEEAYCITVHKSQGSEFEGVVFLIPPAESPILTKELLYTGITRARSQVLLWGTREAVLRAVETPTLRFTGLADRLRPGRG